jgi:hypothetical protein
MTTFVFRLKAPRPSFALGMTDEEREIIGRHAAFWQPFMDSGEMVVFGPVLDGTGSSGLGVLAADSILQRKVLEPNAPRISTRWRARSTSSSATGTRLPNPFEWSFTIDDLVDLMDRLAAHEPGLRLAA